MDQDKLFELWYAFADIPIDNEECIDVDFYIWPKGTDRFAIWHWFDELSPNGIHKMLYDRIPKTNHP